MMSISILLKPHEIDCEALRHVDTSLVWHEAAGVVVVIGGAVGGHPPVSRKWRRDAQSVEAYGCAGLLDDERFGIVTHQETDAVG